MTDIDLAAMFDGIEDGAMKECPQCAGYGSSLEEPEPTCSMCGGDGVVTVASGAVPIIRHPSRA